MERIRLRIEVQGVVQGVWYRRSTQIQAQNLGLVGWVKNNSEGSVSIEAEGSEEQVRRLIAWCHEGPENAKVDTVGASTVDLVGEKDFQIIR